MSTTDSVTFQAYSWEIEDDDDNVVIYCHGLTHDNRRVTVKVPDFKPYVYLELDAKFPWNEYQVQRLKSVLQERMKDKYPIKTQFVERQKIYYFKKAKFLWMAFNSRCGINRLLSLLKEAKGYLNINGVGSRVRLVVHEQKASPVLQLFAARKISPAGWITARRTTKQSLIEEHAADTFSTSDIEFVSSFADLSMAKGANGVVNPKVLSYDIECVSGDASGNTFPKADRDSDQIICICATVARIQDDSSSWKTYSLVNEFGGRKCPNDVPGSHEVRHFRDERALLVGWKNFVQEIDPDVITGYNTLTFDDKYMYDRSQKVGCWRDFSRLGRLIGKEASVEEQKWKSSAYGVQIFSYLSIPGRIHIDMYPVIKKDFGSLSSYKLDAVSEHFLGDHKEDLPANEMIKIWHRGKPEDIKNIIVYCNKDTILPLKLMQKLGTWFGLTEMANVVMTSISDLVTRGQQIRVFSQVYCLTTPMNVVFCSKDTDYRPTAEEKTYVGATVQNPKIGFWEQVAVFDFASLYPTTIMAYNLCFSTFVPEGVNPKPGDYHDLEWEDHLGCEHDTAIRKTKTTKYICGTKHYRFYKAHVKKGIIPTVLEGLLSARAGTRKEIGVLAKELKDATTPEERKRLKLTLEVLDKRQLGYKVSANSIYGGFGSDYSYSPFFPAAAATTAMGRRSIQKAIEVALVYRDDVTVVYGDTDSCFLQFRDLKTIKECFEVSKALEKEFEKYFPAPMHIELEKIYSKLFILIKKKYIGYIVDREGKQIMVDKKGVVIKRRDNCGYLREVYTKLIEMVMNKDPLWKMYDYLYHKVDDLLKERVDVSKLIITKSIKDAADYKNPAKIVQMAVAEKMRARGKYVVAGTRIEYLFVETDNPKAPQYLKAEDPDWYYKHRDTMKIDYKYYFEKQLINAVDEVLEVRFGKKDVLLNLFKLMKKNAITDLKPYFYPKFRVV